MPGFCAWHVSSPCRGGPGPDRVGPGYSSFAVTVCAAMQQLAWMDESEPQNSTFLPWLGRGSCRQLWDVMVGRGVTAISAISEFCMSGTQSIELHSLDATPMIHPFCYTLCPRNSKAAAAAMLPRTLLRSKDPCNCGDSCRLLHAPSLR